MADQPGNIESRVAVLEGRVARLEATGAAPQGAMPATTHVVYHYFPPCGAMQSYMPPCVCGFSSHSVQQDEPATPTPADFSKLGE